MDPGRVLEGILEKGAEINDLFALLEPIWEHFRLKFSCFSGGVFESIRGSILGAFWLHLGAILGRFGSNFGYFFRGPQIS